RRRLRGELRRHDRRHRSPAQGWLPARPRARQRGADLRADPRGLRDRRPRRRRLPAGGRPAGRAAPHGRRRAAPARLPRADVSRTAVVVGAGDVGSAVLRQLAGSGELAELWALDLDGGRARVAVHDAAAIASYTGLAPAPHARAVDVLAVDELATT